MSIFKNTFKLGVQTQIRKRQEAIFDRNPKSIQYFNSRNAWIRMSSAVNINDSDELAKKYILQGGVLLDGKLRSGVGKTGNEAYSTSSPGGVSHRLGIRPMPGITGIDVKSKSAYGSLREVTVNFIAWDLKQLEDLELLYMRPNYSVLIEWGWAPYLDNSGNLQNRINFYSDFFPQKNQLKTKEEIWSETYNKSAVDGNYDAMYGFVKNYSWSARPDGGYDCVTTIISMGEILESLKINYGAFDNENLSKNKGLFDVDLNKPIQEVSSSPINEERERTLRNILNIGPEITPFERSLQSFFGINTQPPLISEYYTQNVLAGICAELRYILTSTFSQEDGPYTLNDPKDKSVVYRFLKFKLEVSGQTSDKKTESSDQIYITLKSFLEILNKYVLLQGTNKQGTGKAIVSFSTKDRDNNDLLCLGNIFQISTNPTVCFIINKFWKDSKNLGLVKEGNFSSIQKLMDLKYTQDYFFEGDYEKRQLGVIGNIYLNLDYLLELATNNNLASQDKKEKNDIAVFDYIKNMMSGVNTAIGNVANFDIHVDPSDSVARIIDINYVDTETRKEAYDNAFMFEVQKIGPISGSIIRNYRLESQIFPEQSTMVAIGAQVQGGALGTNVNTLIDFNRNITDRIIPAKLSPNSIINPDNTKAEIRAKSEALIANFKLIIKYITDLTPDWYELIGDYDVQESSKYANALRDIINFYLSYTNSDIKNRAIIPTKLSLEIDGIGGLVIGNLFRIPDQILPKGYRGGDVGAKIAYTVTGIGHTIQNNDWVTKIDSQFIVLDEPRGGITIEDFLELFKLVTAASSGDIAAVQQLSQTQIPPVSTPLGALYPFNTPYVLTSPSLITRFDARGFPRTHEGSDLAIPVGTPIYAVDDGIITHAAPENLLNINQGYGNYVKINHTGVLKDKTTLSAHLNQILVAKNQQVKRGDLIGYSGNTGKSSGPHLHFEVKDTFTQIPLLVSNFFPGF